MSFKPLFEREIKAVLKNPGFLITLILIPLFYISLGSVMNIGVRSAVSQVSGYIGVVDRDDTPLSHLFVYYLNLTLDGRVSYANGTGELGSYSTIVVIPRGFQEMALNNSANLSTLTRINSLSLVSLGAIPPLALQGSFNDALRYALASFTLGKKIEIGNASLNTSIQLVYQGRVLDYTSVNTFVGYGILSTFIIGIMMSFTAGFATSASAMEKAEKAFELLLSQPVGRSRIVLAKIAASVVAAFIVGLVFFASLFVSVMHAAGFPGGQALPSGGAGGLGRPQVDLGGAVAFTAVTVFLGSLISGSIGVLIGGVVSDERTAGILVTPIVMILFGFTIIAEFIGVSLDAPTAVLSGLTVTPLPLLLSVSNIVGDYSFFYLALSLSIVELAILIGVAIKLYNSEIVITGLHLRKKSPPAYSS
ncbi:MAG: ABC transporter permease [Thermogladius sp.]|jgi:ABC-2 type transport system permease protein|nr:ABC transporter permease [Thermogladius sp.]